MRSISIKKGIYLLAAIASLSLGIFAQNAGGELSAQRWTPVELNGRKVSAATKAFLEINSARDGFAGNAGCNRMFGAVKITGRNIDFGSAGTTKMFCADAGVMRFETDFTNALERATRYRVQGKRLNLYARNRLIAVFRGEKRETGEGNPNAGARLEDKKWMLDSVKNTKPGKNESAPFLAFDRDKQSAGGNSGCNAFGGNYTASGAAINFSGIISTQRACLEDERMNIERKFFDSLQNANRYEIKGGKLYLYKDKKLLLTFTGQNK